MNKMNQATIVTEGLCLECGQVDQHLTTCVIVRQASRKRRAHLPTAMELAFKKARREAKAKV